MCIISIDLVDRFSSDLQGNISGTSFSVDKILVTICFSWQDIGRPTGNTSYFLEDISTFNINSVVRYKTNN